MEPRNLTRRCAGFKNVSMWMDSILTWDESHNVSNDNRHFTKAFKPQPRSSVFFETKTTPIWSSEARESFKPYNVTQLDYQDDGEHARIYKKLLELKSRHSSVDKENTGDKSNQESGSEILDEKKIEIVDIVDASSSNHEYARTEGVAAVDSSPKAESNDANSPRENDRKHTPSLAPEKTADQATSQSTLLLSYPPVKKKPSTQKPAAESQARRQQARQLIKAKWDARRFAQTSRSMSSTRQLSDTAVAFLFGRRPFATFADQTGSRIKDSARLSFNVNPELYPNQPTLVQTVDSAVERAILKSGPQPIGCKQRLKMLQNKQVKNRLQRRQESLARLSQSARGAPSESWPTRTLHAEPGVRRSDGFFVQI